jgi:hypothetical protein
VAKVYNINPHPHWEIFLGLLCFLFALHLYWCDLRCSLPGHSNLLCMDDTGLPCLHCPLLMSCTG